MANSKKRLLKNSYRFRKVEPHFYAVLVHCIKEMSSYIKRKGAPEVIVTVERGLITDIRAKDE